MSFTSVVAVLSLSYPGRPGKAKGRAEACPYGAAGARMSDVKFKIQDRLEFRNAGNAEILRFAQNDSLTLLK